MILTRLSLPDVMLIEPIIVGDDHGFHYESLNRQAFEAATDRSVDFVQENHSSSVKGVLRILHFLGAKKDVTAKHLVETEVFA
ncbi:MULTISPECIES: dTDP-4-dehydrorhamnose 3,5-epimerase family protein [unclassified Pseudomonas]|uniref:dTDP-4-dehydrorhamnose 3,5-epimerase family protein n=1 Tax=unclassified Pseudomonas TaxID=196821 RepID=UPI002AC9BA07|nr:MULTISPECIES: dTDP-4-dehydrorhamnose 3,5-epimerase family protein [unclassified Pseudomonas]MEB0047243.1 dTDP-4-dehydrorhamnose 3,5-epimerase family protein [Pseudomonas sp. Dout3]MEB0096883.1 dTDP-4-dehydrorhamnose 3,5-epimerase family protein [Pseudomonas sp. DC1.2]WPX57396.1 dTDP-4-dehydrorhamnose 3,5-epimerase family protein [Pseudomonas sp. DC1.2]